MNELVCLDLEDHFKKVGPVALEDQGQKQLEKRSAPRLLNHQKLLGKLDFKNGPMNLLAK